MLLRLRRLSVLGPWLLGAFLAGFLLSVHLRGQQDFERRLQLQEDVHADVRLSKIETRLDTIDAVGRWVLGTVLGQFFLTGYLGFRPQRHRGAL